MYSMVQSLRHPLGSRFAKSPSQAPKTHSHSPETGVTAPAARLWAQLLPAAQCHSGVFPLEMRSCRVASLMLSR